MPPGLLKRAVTNDLQSIDKAPLARFLVTNGTCIPLRLYSIAKDGHRQGFNGQGQAADLLPGARITPGTTFTVTSTFTQHYFVALSDYSGALVAIIDTGKGTSGTRGHAITTFDFALANAIGPIPQPASDHVIPLDSPRVLVGCGTLTRLSNLLVREQYWRRLPESYTLAPGQSRTMSVTIETGMQSTTSDLKTVSGSVSASGGGSWSVVGAHVSASLSASASSFQEVTVSSRETTFIEHTITNPDTTKVQAYILWQLTDVITVINPLGMPVAAIVSGEEPAIITGPYDLASIAPPPDLAADPRLPAVTS